MDFLGKYGQVPEDFLTAIRKANDEIEDQEISDKLDKMEQIARDELGLVTPGEYVFYNTSN